MSKEIIIPEKAVLVSRADINGMITYANLDFQKISGYDESELLMQPHSIIRHPDMPSEIFREMWTVLKSGRVWTGVIKNRSKNGDFYWIDGTISPVLESNKIVGFVSVRRKTTLYSIKKTELLIASMQNPDKKVFFE